MTDSIQAAGVDVWSFKADPQFAHGNDKVRRISTRSSPCSENRDRLRLCREQTCLLRNYVIGVVWRSAYEHDLQCFGIKCAIEASTNDTTIVLKEV
jgi:hypothetical protein